MVKIASRDFNKDMGSYIHKRRARERESEKGIRLKLGAVRRKKYEEEVPDLEPTQVHVEYKKPSKFASLFSFRRKLIDETSNLEDLTPEEMAKFKAMEDEIEETEGEIEEKEDEIQEIQEEEAELVERREGLLRRFFKKINVFRRKPMDTVEIPAQDIDETPVLDQDVVDVLKITHKWIEELTPAKKRSFKASKDFQRYKEVLEKHGLIKKR